MAETAITVQTLAAAGTSTTFAAANADGNFFSSAGNPRQRYKNTNGSPRVVTVVAQRACELGTLHDIEITVPATTGDVEVPPVDKRFFADETGLIHVTYDAVTGLTVAVTRDA